MSYEDHEHDEDGNCILPEGSVPTYDLPSWRFSAWDVAGITATSAAGLFSVLGQGLNLLAREFAAMANWQRQNYDLREARRAYEAEQAAIANDLRALVDGGDGS